MSDLRAFALDSVRTVLAGVLCVLMPALMIAGLGCAVVFVYWLASKVLP